MLGEQIGHEIGQVTGVRVLPSDGAPRMEVSFQSDGTILGIHENNMGTSPRPGRTAPYSAKAKAWR